jgi:hypothetical protein
MHWVELYRVCALPKDNFHCQVFSIFVVWRGDGQWEIQRGGEYGRCLDAQGVWSRRIGWNDEATTEEEMLAREREVEEWKARHRFDLETALRLAEEAAPKITVMGHTVEEARLDGAENI